MHVHSGYSLARRPVTLERLVATAAAFGHAHLAVTDINSLCGAPRFHRLAEQHGLAPIIGSELRLPDVRAVALVESQAGYANLCRLITIAKEEEEEGRVTTENTEGVGNYEFGIMNEERAPTVGQIHNTKFITHNSLGLSFIAVDTVSAERLIHAGLDPSQLHVGIDPAAQSRPHLYRLLQFAEDHALPTVATATAMLLEPADRETARLLAAIRLNMTLANVPDTTLPAAGATLRRPDDLAACYARFPQALDANRRLAERTSHFRLLPRRAVFPAFPTAPGETHARRLRALCQAGLQRRYGPAPSRDVLNRLSCELQLIHRMGFCEYFLVVHDIVGYARRHNAPVAGRGSGASSIVAYLLDITNVCPLACNIPFERFLHEQREDFPDLDIDLCWRIRDDVIDYAFRRWGRAPNDPPDAPPSRAAMVCTHQVFQDRSALRQAAKALGLSDAQISRFARHPQTAVRTADAATQDQLRRVLDFADRITGLPHAVGLHPGGIVLAPGRLDAIAPLQASVKGPRVTQYDKHGVADIGLVKIDLLGNRNLSTVRYAIQLIDNNVTTDTDDAAPTPFVRGAAPAAPRPEVAEQALHHPQTKGFLQYAQTAQPLCHVQTDQIHDHPRTRLAAADFIAAIPHDDPATLATLRSARTIGCNQLESPAMRHLLAAMQPTHMLDVMKTLALIRPGAASIGMKDTFVRRHRGEETPPPLPSPVARVLADSHGVMLYEDDVLTVIAAMTGLDLGAADRFRRAIQKCFDDDQRRHLSQRFLNLCRDNGQDLAFARDMWVQMAKFNAYSFCRAHAGSYAQLAYAGAYLKTHHPLAFWTAALNNNQSMYHSRLYVDEARRGGVRPAGVDVNRSVDEFSIDADAAGPVLRAGLGCVDGLGEVAAGRIIQARQTDGPFTGLGDFLARTRLSESDVRALILCGAFDGLGRNRPTLLMQLQMLIGRRGSPPSLLTPEDPHIDLPPDAYSPQRRALDAWRITGLSIDRPFIAWSREALTPHVDAVSHDLPHHIGRRVRIAGVLEARRVARTMAGEPGIAPMGMNRAGPRDYGGRPMMFVTLADEWGVFEVTVFPDAYRRLGPCVNRYGPFIVAGRLEQQHNVISITADDLKPYKPYNSPPAP
ncbi:MAG: DNA polymerase III subunit alpha [Planctomycetes bacterium]|nr:DNA polymerase III subunit alpha [Planctomycetota bacterium]